ncbi:aminoglycoside N(3)-acetyltransferase [Streptacidiphilus sp. N1-3]|uniref:Aminoglycoside N(3)-acetyltransferase n=1 Tax=Streptacidiphilus alkalitolerans TaxID=3342712 RepID=A0ABV6X688_9ACTN
MIGRQQLVDDLGRIGIRPGGVLFAQSSLRSIGQVRGGARTVVAALREVLGPQGTLVVYTATPENSLSSPAYLADTAAMGRRSLRIAYRAAMQPFDIDRSPSSRRTVGMISEAVRTTPGARRSAHPQTSFVAIGPRAEEITADHRLECHLGEDSPVGRLYELQAQGLLLGVDSWRFTPYHLAEYYPPNPPVRMHAALVSTKDRLRCWKLFDAVDLDDSHFQEMGERVRSEVPFGEGRVGAADCYLVPLVPAVAAARRWVMERYLADRMSGPAHGVRRRLHNCCMPPQLWSDSCTFTAVEGGSGKLRALSFEDFMTERQSVLEGPL